MEKMVLDEHDLSARWGVNVKTLKRWRNEGRGPRYIKIGRSVTYLPKDIEHFETHALYIKGSSAGAVEPLSLATTTPSHSRAVVPAGPRSPQQEIVDLMATALLRLRAAGPPPSHPSQTPTVNEVGREVLSLYGRSRGAVEPLQLDMSTQPSSCAVVTTGPRSPQQEIVDLMAVALLRLRAAGPPPSHPSQTPTVNEVGKEELARRRFVVRVLTRMTDEG